MSLSQAARIFLPCQYFLALLLLWAAPVKAQLTAGFAADQAAGCSPLTIYFTNTTTGASPNASYNWDFGNGKTSTLTNPGTTYINEQTYTVTLTVQDGSQTSAKSLTITVYKKPVVNFSVTPASGCAPLPVTFSSNSMAGDGSIASYFWDFGDGSTRQGAGLGQVSHTYTFAQTASVSLTVTNSEGCSNTLQQQAVVISPAVTAGFTADKTAACQVTDPIQFTNSATGSGPLSYQWDFGDGTTSTAPNPSHVFSQKGIYTISLTVTNPGGCTATNTLTNYINVADFTTSFTVASPICQGLSVQLTDNSTPKAGSGTWTYDDGTSSNSSNGTTTHVFTTPGAHTVTLTNTYGACQQSVSQPVTVQTGPALNGFTIDPRSLCGAPVTIDFADNTAAAAQWQWNFGDGSSSTLQTPSHTYNNSGIYTVQLTVTSTSGCSSSTSRTVNTQSPAVSIYYTNSTSPEGNAGCSDFSISFGATSSTDPIAGYSWDFGDGSNSTDAQPTHHFTVPGIYIVHLYYTTQQGCQGVAIYNAVKLYKPPVANFTVLPGTTICGSSPVNFIDQSQGPVTSWFWTFGDNSGFSTAADPVYQYAQGGVYTITLTATNGVCSNTISKTNYITVLPPFPKITGYVNTCNDTRGLVTLSQQSGQALSWTWDFGDGSSTLSPGTDQPTVQHLYTRTGVYKVSLTTTNGACTVKDSINVDVLLRQAPLLTSSTPAICAGDALDVQISHLEINPSSASPYGYTFSSWQYGDATTVTGNAQPPGISTGSNTYNGTLRGLTPGESGLRVILVSGGFGCQDISNFIPLTIKGPVAAYNIIPNDVCLHSPVIFRNASYGTGNVPISTWEWNFGDQQTQSSPNGNDVTHYYSAPGNYYPVLTVTDMDGCSATTSLLSDAAVVNGPQAAFTYSPALVSPATLVNFYNNTNNTGSYNTQYQWSFGDGTTSSVAYPSHSYSSSGTDTVKLIAESPSTQCADTAIEVIIVKTVHTSFTYTTDYINNNNCPPVLASFVNTSVNANSVSWAFGDGSSAANQNYPTHTFLQPGIYRVVLYGYGNNGAIDSTADSITIAGPYAILHADALSGCTGQSVTLSATVKNASSFTWDFADGTLDQTQDTFAVHRYLTGGLYTPALILKDQNGCSGTSGLSNPIIIDSLHISLSATPSHVCISTPLTLDPEVSSLAANQLQQTLQYSWNFGTGIPGDTSNAADPVFTYRQTGLYPVTLQVISPYGCIKDITDILQVVTPRPFQLQLAADTFACPGKSIRLEAGGAVSYNWIHATGLDSSQSADPVAQPPLQSAYTVVGYDQYQCFTDTATVQVHIAPLPTVSVGPQQTIELLTGSTLQLNAIGSSDVTQWNWSPPDFLSCTDCPSPVCTPRSSVNYTVTAGTQYGCTDSATLSIKLICDEGRVYIPNSFTPNNDGNNDIFYIKGKGIRIIKYLRIFNRWGDMMFEHTNFNIDDQSAGWDGSFKGRPVESGTYIYLTEMVCDSGETFPLKGTLILIR